MHRLLQAVPYWGQSSSLASCLGVRSAAPLLAECAFPLDLLDDAAPLRPYFSCPVTEFRSNQLSWEDVVPGGNELLPRYPSQRVSASEAHSITVFTMFTL